MENATKALLIAAAILIAILIISLSLVVYRMAAETVGNVNLSEAEMAEFNGKFEASAGTRVSGSKVNALLSTIVSHNAQADAAGEPKITLPIQGNAGAAIVVAANGVTTITKVNTGGYYAVTLGYDANGLVTTVTINNI